QGVMVPRDPNSTMLPQGSIEGATDARDVDEFSYQWSIDDTNTCPLSVFFFDTTSTRKYTNDAPERLAANESAPGYPNIILKLTSWARNLKSPGILILGQPLLVPRRYKALFGTITADYHPSAFSDFDAIMAAIVLAPWDILVIGGDVHWSRLVDCDIALF